MKREIIKKTLLYRVFSFGLTMLISTLILYFFFNDMMNQLSWHLSIWTEIGAVCLYYTFEYYWRKTIEHINLKKGMNIMLIKNGTDKHGWYEVTKVPTGIPVTLEEDEFVVKVI